MECLSVPKVIKSHRGRYDSAFLLSETDGNDVTYFVNHNLDMVTEAVNMFVRYAERKAEEQSDVLKDARAKGLSVRQADVLSDLIHSGEPMDIDVLSSKYLVSAASIRRDLLKLMDMGLARQVRSGRRILFEYTG